MNFPGFLRNFAVIQLIAVFIYGATGIISIYALSKGASDGILTPLPVITALLINACWIFMLAAAVFWIRKSVHSLSFVFGNSIFTSVTLLFIAAVTVSSIDEAFFMNILFILFFFIIPVFSWIIFFKTRKFYAEEASTAKDKISKPVLVFFYALIILCAIAFILIRMGSVAITLPIQDAAEGKSVPSKTIIRVYDDSELTWWTPVNKTGIEEFITLETRNPGYISGIRISGGAHFPKIANAPLSFKSYSRPEKISVELSNGQKYRFTCKDSPDTQEFTFPAGIAHWVRITFHSTYKGEKWDELCISEIAVLGKKSFFKK